MSRFLKTVATEILQLHGNDLSRLLVLFPNHRSIQYFKQELMQLADKPIVSPELQTLQQYMLSFSNLTLADDMELVTALYGSYRKVGGEKTMDDFIGFADALLSDFDELDMQMVNAKLFFKELETLQSMKSYVPGEDPSASVLEYRKFWLEFGKMYDAIQQELASAGKGYTGMILRQIAEGIHGSTTALDYTAVYLVGFSGLNKCDEVFIEWLKQAVPLKIYNDADSFYVKNNVREAGYFFRKHHKLLQMSEAPLQNELLTRKRSVDVVGAPKLYSQVNATISTLQQWQITDTEWRDTVVVVPDEKLLPLLIHQLPNNVTALNITMGLSAQQSSVFELLDTIFHAALNMFKYNSSSGSIRIYHKDIFNLLQLPLVSDAFLSYDAGEFIRKVKASNKTFVSYDDVLQQLGKNFVDLIFIGSSCVALHQHLLEVVNKLTNHLKKQYYLGIERAALEIEFCTRISAVISQSAKLLQNEEQPSLHTFVKLMIKKIKNIRVPFEGDAMHGLQLMGLQETRSITFKNVIILSANEGTLPSGKFQNSFIPFEIRKVFELDTHTERDAVSAYLFYRLLQQADRVAIFYNTEPDELGGGEMSRFLLQLQTELNSKNSNTSIRFSTHQVPLKSVAEHRNIVVYKSTEVLRKQVQLLTESGLSPSALNTYINCSLQYYFRYIAGVKEQDEVEETPEASSIGDAVHDALEKIYLPYIGRVISSDVLKSVLNDKAYLESLIRKKLNERFDDESLSNGKNLLIYRVCIKLLTEFLQSEIKQIEKLEADNAVMQIEELEAKWIGALHVGGIDVIINGRVDRMHRIGQSIYIADYKTGKYRTLPKLSEEDMSALRTDVKYSKVLQLMMYAWLFQHNNITQNYHINTGIYWLQSTNKQLAALEGGDADGSIPLSWILLFEDVLKEVAQEMMDPNIAYTQTSDSERCKFCDFKSICNREEVSKRY
ncbi:MAG: PD-(D/E)XK nuclease family protein [Chitinophagales bacterium]|nr:PD-(D/E)XK nuclease family protein [Chitinophagales bacterium]